MDLTKRETKLKDLPQERRADIAKSALNIPRFHLIASEYSVYGDPVITPSSLVTLSLKFVTLKGLAEFKGEVAIVDPEVEKMGRKWWEQAVVECASIN